MDPLIAAGDHDNQPLEEGSRPTVAERLLTVARIGRAFAERLDLDTLVPMLVDRCRDVLGSEATSVLLFDASRNELYFPYVGESRPSAAMRLRGMRFPASLGFAGEALRCRRAFRVDDVSTDPRFYVGIDEVTGTETRSLLVAPLRNGADSLGVIEVVNRRDGGPFDDDDLALLEELAASVAIAITNAQRYAAVRNSEQRLQAEVHALRQDLARQGAPAEIVGKAPSMIAVFRLMESAASSDIAVLIEGETGTGKELVARGIHRASARAERPFLAVNCAALSETLLESELFGHRRGAFTGATQDRLGLFETASGGTVLLDEVGEMPVAMQAKLLRVLQEGEVVPVGDHRARPVDARIISATNRDLHAEMLAGRFRKDLYYRLAAFPVRLSPLRERPEDIPALAEAILVAAGARHGKRVPSITKPALEALLRYEWPGNVRELENELRRAVVLVADGGAIGLAHLSSRLVAGGADAAPGAVVPSQSLRKARAAFEAQYIDAVLRRESGNVTRAARTLGVSRAILHKKMNVHGLR
jgi:Nif-specific regulatory protein